AEAAEATADLKVGSDDWWEKVDLCNQRNSAHLSEEERQGLTDFRRHVPAERRRTLGVKYLAFEAANIKDYARAKKDPDAYIEKHANG
ncbi:MAG: cation-binding protein, partial [Pontixanthobacter sp.]